MGPSAKWSTEAVSRLRYLIALLTVLGLIAGGCHSSGDVWSPSQSRQSDVQVRKEPIALASHTFDPLAPPPDMPRLSAGETAQCDSNFLSRASVRGQPRRTDATHATVTIMQVKIDLKLQVNIWIPSGASQVVVDHEDGHRQISEYYYQTADKLAQQIGASYIGKHIDITGTDLDAECAKALLQTANEITEEYNKKLNANPTQLLYDDITDHARNGVIASDAVDHALKNAAIEATQPTGGSGT